MEDFKIITVENNESFVTIDTLVKFSGNAEEAVRTSLRKYKEEIETVGKKPFCLVYSGGLRDGKIDWSSVKLNEDHASFVLTLMQNTAEVVRFKMDLVMEFSRFKNQKVEVLTPLQMAQKANEMYEIEVQKQKKEIEFKKKLLKGSEIVIQNIADDIISEEIDMEEYCQLLSSRATDTYLGRTKVYTLLRLMKLVKQGKTTPTQYATEVGYLKLRHHEHGVSTKVVREKMSKLTAKVIKYLLNNEDVNESLGFPFHPELRD